MYDIALTVAACLRAQTQVEVAWVVDVRGFSSRNRVEALAATPGGGRVGSLISGALDEQVAWLLTTESGRRLVTLEVNEIDAAVAGLSCGGTARCILTPASDLPAELWPRLLAREPLCLVTATDDDRVGETIMFTPGNVADAGPEVERLFFRGLSETAVLEDMVVTALWPVPRLVTVGTGSVADALGAAVRLLDWEPETVNDARTAIDVIAGFSAVDSVVVTSHDLDVAGPALAEALAGRVSYIGALGSRRTQQARAEWLSDRGIVDLDRIHGPAGLNIGASTPAEIAVSIVAEMLATRSGATPGSLRDSGGPIHARTPWPYAR